MQASEYQSIQMIIVVIDIRFVMGKQIVKQASNQIIDKLSRIM
jgi:hypothetical protein